jgi:hypothetical protein
VKVTLIETEEAATVTPIDSENVSKMDEWAVRSGNPEMSFVFDDDQGTVVSTDIVSRFRLRFWLGATQ